MYLLCQTKKSCPCKNFLFSLHILPNVRTNSLFHTVKYKNHSVGYIFHTVGYKSRTVKQRIPQCGIHISHCGIQIPHCETENSQRQNKVCGRASGLYRRNCRKYPAEKTKKILKADTSTNVSFQDLQPKARLASQTILLPAQSAG